MRNRSNTRTGGRSATTGHIPGDYALSVGLPDISPPEGWIWTALSEVARLETGHTPSRKYPEYWNGNIPWVGIRDATGNHGQVIYDTAQHTNQLGIDNSSARVLPTNTVCLSRTASVGYVVVMGQPMATSQDFVNWVCSPDLHFHYLKYVLLAEKRSFLRFAHGTTHQTIYFPEGIEVDSILPISSRVDVYFESPDPVTYINYPTPAGTAAITLKYKDTSFTKTVTATGTGLVQVN